MVFKPKTKQQNPKDDVLQKYVVTHLNTQVTVSLMNSLRGIKTPRALPFRRTLPYTTLKEIKMPKKLSLSVCLFALSLLYSCQWERVEDSFSFSLSEFTETFGSPHIIDPDEGVCYYMGTWGPGGTLMKIRFQDDTILSMESEHYEEAILYTYMPRLIESLRNQGNVANQALSFLTSVAYLTYPNGYGEYYMTDTPYKNTPFEKYPPVWDSATYQKWKGWWQREGQFHFLPFQDRRRLLIENR